MKGISRYLWYGYPAHHVLRDHCRFHLTTSVGQNLISTIGDCYISGKAEKIGSDRIYETLVFRIKGKCQCGCGLPEAGDELYSEGYNTAIAASKGHMALCWEYSRPKHQPPGTKRKYIP